MYKAVYTVMVESRVAIILDKEVQVNRQWQVTINKDKAYGQKTRHLLTCPEMVLFVDNVGNNISQKNDGDKSLSLTPTNIHSSNHPMLTATSPSLDSQLPWGKVFVA